MGAVTIDKMGYPAARRPAGVRNLTSEVVHIGEAYLAPEGAPRVQYREAGKVAGRPTLLPVAVALPPIEEGVYLLVPPLVAAAVAVAEKDRSDVLVLAEDGFAFAAPHPMF